MTTPTIHLNGTSRDALIESRSRVYDALRNTLDAMKEMAPNGRDYYVDPDPDAFESARRLHERRGQVVLDLMAEIESEMDAICDQG